MDVTDSSQPESAPHAAHKRTRRDPPQLLTPDQQELVLNEISRGHSVSHACRKLDLLPGDYAYTLRRDPFFAGLCAFSQLLLTGDVEMSVYATAMKGTAAAQALYLKFHPPPPSENVMRGDNFEELTEAELFDLAKQMGVPVPPEWEPDES